MKKFTLVFTMMAVVFAQNAPIDFEADGNGANWNWIVDQNGSNPALQFPANPVSGGINTSATVAQFSAEDAGQDWALCYTDDIDEFEFDATNTTVTIMVYKSVISNVGIKLEGASNAEILVANTVIGQWEELTYDFSGSIGNTYNRLVIIPDFAPREQDNTIYFDNIQLPEGNVTPPAEPTVAAPTPTTDAANVISLFSNAYTNVTVDTWSAEWDQANVADAQVVGDDVKLYTNLVYAGIEFTSQTIDASSMTHFHMDIWTPDATSAPAVFKVKLVDFGADGAWSGGDDVDHELTFDENTMATGTWVSLDVPLSDFTGLTTTGHLAQMIIAGEPNTVYVDNVYLWRETFLSLVGDLTPEEFALHQNYPNPFNPITQIKYDLPEDALVNITIYDLMGRSIKSLVNSNQSAGYRSIQWDATNNLGEPVSAGMYIYMIQAGEFRQTKKMVLLK